jgi:hypothetical protein
MGSPPYLSTHATGSGNLDRMDLVDIAFGFVLGVLTYYVVRRLRRRSLQRY